MLDARRIRTPHTQTHPHAHPHPYTQPTHRRYLDAPASEISAATLSSEDRDGIVHGGLEGVLNAADFHEDGEKVVGTGTEHKRWMSPSSKLRMYWDMSIMGLLVYVSIFTPVQITFLGSVWTARNIGDWAFIFAVDRLVDAIFLIDIVFNFRTGWHNDDGRLCFDPKVVAIKYLKLWFWVDLFSVLPYEVLDTASDVGPHAPGEHIAVGIG